MKGADFGILADSTPVLWLAGCGIQIKSRLLILRLPAGAESKEKRISASDPLSQQEINYALPSNSILAYSPICDLTACERILIQIRIYTYSEQRNTPDFIPRTRTMPVRNLDFFRIRTLRFAVARSDGLKQTPPGAESTEKRISAPDRAPDRAPDLPYRTKKRRRIHTFMRPAPASAFCLSTAD